MLLMKQKKREKSTLRPKITVIESENVIKDENAVSLRA